MLRTIYDDDRGVVLSTELILLAVVVLIGLIAGLGSVRDAVVSELSDISGAMQDSNQSFLVQGVTGHSASVAGMDFIDGLDHCDDQDDLVGVADNCIVMSEPPAQEGSNFVTTVFGHPTDSPSRFVDSWRANLVIDEEQTFTSASTNPITVLAETFQFYAGRIGGLVTPFIVSVFGDNDFEVVAVGDTIAVTALGEQIHDFSNGQTSINVEPGETLAFGFLDANPDGTGSNHSVIRFNQSANEIWYSGGPGDNESGGVAVGSAPTPGNRTLLNLNRDYQFGIGLGIPQ